jgi:hypothetical protein
VAMLFPQNSVLFGDETKKVSWKVIGLLGFSISFCVLKRAFVDTLD